MKILVAEDNEDSRNLLVKIISVHGHEVMAVANGVDALSQALVQPPDIIVSDILMPKMDGYQLCYHWKQNDKLKDIPFVFYTATYTSDEDKKFALSMGAEAFLIKPIDHDIFIGILGETFEKAKSSLQPSPEATLLEPSIFFTEYHKRIFSKLEEKVAQLELEITERKKTEEELQRQNTFLNIVMESLTH
ncbi:MAG: response regulator, partial [Dehalococcoidales bacterium]